MSALVITLLSVFTYLTAATYAHRRLAWNFKQKHLKKARDNHYYSGGSEATFNAGMIAWLALPVALVVLLVWNDPENDFELAPYRERRRLREENKRKELEKQVERLEKELELR